MFNDFGLLVGEYNSTLPTLVNAEKSELQLDDSGRLIISGRYLEDSGHSSGDAGIFMMGVRNDADAVLTDADLDYSPIAVDDKGRVKVLADLDVDFDFVHAEDSGHTTGDLGSFSLSIRLDDIDGANSALLAGTNGDYQGFFTNTKGELFVKDADTLAQLVTIDAVLDTIKVDTGNIATDVADIEAILDSVRYAEDSGHTTADQGIFALAVRNDSNAVLTDADLDYSGIAVDSAGRVKIVGSLEIEGDEEYAVSDALGNDLDGLIDISAGGWVDIASVSIGAGETGHVYGWQFAADGNASFRMIVDDGTNIQVYKHTLNSSAMPGGSEHFDTNGRIEIPGSATTTLKIQAAERGTGSSSADNASGSIHIRKV
jgi:hypothetical protein